MNGRSRRLAVGIAAAALTAAIVLYERAPDASAIELTADGPAAPSTIFDVGETATFQNSTGGVVTVSGMGGAIDSGPIPPGGSFHVGLTLPGTYTWTSEVGEGLLVAVPSLGDADATVADGMERVPFPPRPPGDLAFDPRAAMETSLTRVLIRFAPETTVSEVRATLANRNLVAIGTIPRFGLVLASTTRPQAGHTAVRNHVHQLRWRPEVLAAIHDRDEDLFRLPAPAALADEHPMTWSPLSVEADGSGVFWGHQVGRLPAAWNLLEALEQRERTPPAVVVFDRGFEAHEDLQRLELLELCQPGSGRLLGSGWCTSTAPDDHGNQVAGVIAASFDRRGTDGHRSLGTTGVDPVGRVLGLSNQRASGRGDRVAEILALLLDELESGRLADVTAINLSFGREADPERWVERWAGERCGPGLNDDAGSTGPCLPHTEDASLADANGAGEIMRGIIETYVQTLDAPPLFVFAAGNASDDFCVPLASSCEERVPQPATFSSPGAYASVTWDDAVGPNPILVVESLGDARRDDDGVARVVPGRFRSPFSNVGGDLSAPGSFLLPGSSGPGSCAEGTDGYCIAAGTSFAAPYVAGVANLLRTWDPTLTAGQLREHLLRWSVADVTGGAAPRLDPYLALTALPGVATALADINDPSADGNRRVVRAPDGTELGLDVERSTRSGAASDPDGVIDMRDFRRFRDAWLLRCTIAPEPGCPGVIALDGPADHPKRDENLDGCIGLVAPDPASPCPSETTWSRLDLNGDGEVSRVRRALVGLRADGSPAAHPDEAVEMTDLEVLASQWQTGAPGTDGVAADELDRLLVSGDLTLFPATLLPPGGTGTLVASTPQVDGRQEVAVRPVSADDPEVVLTVPAGEEVVVTLTPDDAIDAVVLGPVTLLAGEDGALGSCDRLGVEVAPGTLRPNGGTAQITVEVERCDDALAGTGVQLRVDPMTGDGPSLVTTTVVVDAEGLGFGEVTSGSVVGEYEIVATLDLTDEDGDLRPLAASARLRIAEPYLFDELATTVSPSGYASLIGTGPLGPSIGRDGSVAFRARLVGAPSDTVMVADPSVDPQDPSSALDLAAGLVADGARVVGSPHSNGDDAVVAAFEWLASPDTIASVVHRLDPRGLDDPTEIAGGSVGVLGGTSTRYQSVAEPAVNAAGTVVFRAIDGPSGDPIIARSSDEGPVDGPVTPAALPRIADDGSVVTLATEQIGVDDRGLPILGNLVLVSDGIDDPRLALAASGEDGWTFLGRPAISATGQIIVFVGDRGAGPGLQVAVRDGDGLGSWRLLGPVAGAGRVGELGPGVDGTTRRFVDLPRGANRPGVVHLPSGAGGLTGDRLVVSFLGVPDGPGEGFLDAPGWWVQEIELDRDDDGLTAVPGRPVAVLQHGMSVSGSTVRDIAIADPIAQPFDPVSTADHLVAALVVTDDGQTVVRGRWQGAADGLRVHRTGLVVSPPIAPQADAGAPEAADVPSPLQLPLLRTTDHANDVAGPHSDDGPILLADIEVLDGPHLPAFVLSAGEVRAGTPVTVTNRSRTLDGRPAWGGVTSSSLQLTDLPRPLRPDGSTELLPTRIRTHTVVVASPLRNDGDFARGQLRVVGPAPVEVGIELDGPWAIPVGMPVTLVARPTGTGPLEVTWDLNGDGTPDRITPVVGSVVAVTLDAAEVASTVCGGACAEDVPYPIRVEVRELTLDERAATAAEALVLTSDADAVARVTPGLVSVQPGSSATFWVLLQAVGGFGGSVEVALEGIPDGWSGSASRSVAVGGNPSGPFAVPDTAATSLSVSVPTGAPEAIYPLEVVVRFGATERRLPVQITTAFGLVPTCTGDLVVQLLGPDGPLDGGSVSVPALSWSVPTGPDGIARFTDVELTDGATSRTFLVNAGRAGYYARSNVPALFVCGDEILTRIRTTPWDVSDATGQVVLGIATGSATVIPTDEVPEDAQLFRQLFFGSSVGSTFRYDEDTGVFDWEGLIWNSASTPAARVTARADGFWEVVGTASLVRDDVADLGRLALLEQCTATIGELRAIEQVHDGSQRPLPDLRFGVGGTQVFTDEDGIARMDVEQLLGTFNRPRTQSIGVQLPPGFPNPRNRTVQVQLSTCGEEVDATFVFEGPPPPPEPVTATMSGRVVDEETGAPIAGAVVQVVTPPPPSTIFRGGALTDEDGRYLIDPVRLPSSLGPTEEIDLVVRATADGYWSAEEPVTFAPDAALEQDLALLAERRGTIEGRVVDVDTGAPIDRVEVSVSGLVSRPRTDTEGRFRFDNVPLGERNTERFYLVSASRQFTEPFTYWSGSAVFGVTADAPATGDIELLAYCEPATISGVIVNAATLEPLEEVTVRVNLGGVTEVSTTSDADGRFLLTGVRPGSFNEPTLRTVVASKEGFAPGERRLTVFCGAQLIADFGQPPGGFGSITGTVSDADGVPVPGAFVGSAWGDATTTDLDGRYAFDRAPLQPDGTPREWLVTARDSGRSASGTVTVDADETAVLDLVLIDDADPDPEPPDPDQPDPDQPDPDQPDPEQPDPDQPEPPSSDPPISPGPGPDRTTHEPGPGTPTEPHEPARGAPTSGAAAQLTSPLETLHRPGTAARSEDAALTVVSPPSGLARTGAPLAGFSVIAVLALCLGAALLGACRHGAGAPRPTAGPAMRIRAATRPDHAGRGARPTTWASLRRGTGTEDHR